MYVNCTNQGSSRHQRVLYFFKCKLIKGPRGQCFHNVKTCYSGRAKEVDKMVNKSLMKQKDRCILTKYSLRREVKEKMFFTSFGSCSPRFQQLEFLLALPVASLIQTGSLGCVKRCLCIRHNRMHLRIHLFKRKITAIPNTV